MVYDSPSGDEVEGARQCRQQRNDEVVDELARADHRLVVQVDAVGAHPESILVELPVERDRSLYIKPSKYINMYMCVYICICI